MGVSGANLRTTNGGQDWIDQPRATSSWLFDVHFIDSDHGVAVGDGGTIIRSTDGGVTWSEQASPTGHTLYGVSFGDISSGIAVGYNGTILKTSDGGVTWEIQESGTELDLYDVFHTAPMTATIVGLIGTILHTTTGGIVSVQVQSEVGRPVQTLLLQNYPNPFNPSTTIRFSIPKSGEVSLKIFNLLGEEVATLVSENRDAGSHTVQWDATGQPSGVYFYRLRAGDFVETRKLVLLR